MESNQCSPQQEPIIVICACDNKYTMPLSVVICSAFKNLHCDRSILFYIIDGGISKKNQQKLLSLATHKNQRIEFIKVSNKTFSNLKEVGHFSRVMYFRLLIPKLLPLEYSKVIYLDSDLIVQGNLGELWDIDIDDYYLLAVQSLGIPYVSSPYGLRNYHELGIPEKSKYFNSGVLVINLPKWREDNISQRVIEYIQSYQDILLWPDQDGLNAILANKWKELSPKWNQTPCFYSKENLSFSEQDFHTALYEPSIIHFASVHKPWNSHFYHPANNLYYYHLDMTPWSGWRFNLWENFKYRLTKKIRKIMTFN